MATNPNLTDQDYELLSAYLDNQLTEAERTALEARLQAEPDLRRELASLRQTRALVHQLPLLKAPRDFTLDASFARIPRTRRILAFPAAFSALSAAAAIVLFLFGGYFLTRSSFQAAPLSSRPAQVAQIPTLDIVTEQVDAISAAPAAADSAPDEAVEEAAPDAQSEAAEPPPFAELLPYGTDSPPADAFTQEAMEDEAAGEAEADAPPSVMRAFEPTIEATLTEPDTIVDPREQLLPPTRLPPAAGADAPEQTTMMQAATEEAANSAMSTIAEPPPTVTPEPPLPTPAPTPRVPAADDRALGTALTALGAVLLAFAAITTAARRRIRQ